MAEIIIRPESKQDFLETLEIKRLGWLSAYSEIFSAEAINNHFDLKKNNPDYINEHQNLVQNTHQLFVAELDGTVVATMNIAQKFEEDDFVEIMWLYVHPNYQRMGIGKKLYDFASFKILEGGTNKIHIEALSKNKVGCSFYAKTGGKIISSRTRHMLGIEAELVTFEFDISSPVLETERLILRKYQESDIDDYFEYASSPDVGPRIGFEPHTNIHSAKERLAIEMAKPFHFAIVLKDTNKVIGSVELMQTKTDRYKNLEIEEGSKEIGFLLSPAFWGKGIMPEAAKAVLAFAFETLFVPAIYIGHATANTQSARVQEKLGFKIVGELENYRTWIDGSVTGLIERKMTNLEWKLTKNTH